MPIALLFALTLFTGHAPNSPRPVEAPDSTYCEAVVPAPPEVVWKAFTTKEGLESWMVGHASFDLRVGGLMRTKYAKEGQLGDPDTIENEVIAFDPGRMLAIRVHKPPAGFKFPNAIKTMWTVIYFDPTPDGNTKVRCRGLGFTPDEESQAMRGHFEAGNKWTVDRLAAHFKK